MLSIPHNSVSLIPNFMNFAKYFAILDGKRKTIFFARSAKKWILIIVKLRSRFRSKVRSRSGPRSGPKGQVLSRSGSV